MISAAVQTRSSINDYFNDDFMMKSSLSHIPSQQQRYSRPILNYSDMITRPTPVNKIEDPKKI